MSEKILIVDDDTNICELLKLYFEKEGYKTAVINNGADAVKEVVSNPPSLVLLDVMLPGLDGWQVCRKIREANNVPIIMLSAKSEAFDRILGLELGADDYIVKPFETREVVARVKAVLRRAGSGDENRSKEVEYDGISINISTFELKVNGVRVDTPPKEMELLYHLASNPNKVYTRDQLLDEVWGFDYYGDSRTVDVHIKRLREKLEGVSDKWEIATVWSVGYKFATKE